MNGRNMSVFSDKRLLLGLVAVFLGLFSGRFGSGSLIVSSRGCGYRGRLDGSRRGRVHLKQVIEWLVVPKVVKINGRTGICREQHWIGARLESNHRAALPSSYQGLALGFSAPLQVALGESG